jgi:hypothetical protein
MMNHCMPYELRDTDAGFRANDAGFHVFDRIA